MLPSPTTPARTLPIPLRRRRVLTDIARMFSTIFNPFLTSFALLVLMSHALASSTGSFWLLLFTGAFFTSIAPMLFVLAMYLVGTISDLDMSVRSEREAVFGAFVAFYFLGTVTLWLMHAPALIVATMAGYTASTLVVQIITRYWKISTHALGITAPLAALFVLYGPQPLPFALLVPIVCWSRVYLKAHTILQVVAGSALGLASVVIFFHLFHLV